MNEEQLKEAIAASAASVASLGTQAEAILAISQTVVRALLSGAKVLSAGNGGSAAESLHLAEELIGRFRGERVSLPGISLVADTTALTCIGNDYGFDRVFSRQVEGLGRNGDVLVLFSTSGNSRNLVPALEAAEARGVTTIALLGRDGGALAGRADLELIVAGGETARIQEAHQVVVHLILEAVEAAYTEKP